MQAQMEVGASCASGGPYEIVAPCPDARCYGARARGACSAGCSSPRGHHRRRERRGSQLAAVPILPSRSAAWPSPSSIPTASPTRRRLGLEPGILVGLLNLFLALPGLYLMTPWQRRNHPAAALRRSTPAQRGRGPSTWCWPRQASSSGPGPRTSGSEGESAHVHVGVRRPPDSRA